MSNSIYELSDEEFIRLIKESHNISEVLFKLKLSVKGNTWGYTNVRQRMRELGINGNSFIGISPLKGKGVKFGDSILNEELFTENCSHARNILRKRIILDKLIDYKCAICGIDSWNGKELSLELDHINGVNNDNRLENLRFLCPNCHSQTSTYGSRNSNKKIHYNLSKKERQLIINTYKELNNRDLVYKKLNFSRAAIKQVLDSLKPSINTQNQKYVIRYNLQHEEISRWGSIKEMCKDLLRRKETDAETIEGIRGRFLRRIKYYPKDIWLNSYWEVINARSI